MLVVGIAHRDEIRASRAMERSLFRLSTLAKNGKANEKRWDRAIVAFREHRHAFAAAQRRHSRWYRAYIRART